MLGIWVVAATMGWTRDIDVERIRQLVLDSGSWGVLVYLLVFAGAELAHVPGMIFVLAAMAIWGRTEGLVIGYLGANLSVVTSFVTVRAIGGKTLTMMDNKWLKWALAKLDARPLVTVTMIRMVFWLAPAANYALALSPVRLPHFILGSALGLLPPVIVVSIGFEWAMTHFAC